MRKFDWPLFVAMALNCKHYSTGWRSMRHDPVWPRHRLRGERCGSHNAQNTLPDLCRRVTLTDATEVSFW